MALHPSFVVTFPGYLAPLSEDLSRLAGVGLEALQFLERQERALETWASEARRVLENAAGPDFIY